jgi:capsular polysaccharide biosynthesis protein
LSSARQTDDSDLKLIARVIQRRIWVVALCFVAATLAAAALTVREEKQYASTSALLLRAGDEPQRAVDTNLQLLSLPVIATLAAEELPGFSAGEIEAAVSPEQQGESDIIKITATTSSATRSALIANAFADAFATFRARSYGEKLRTGRVEVVERATPNTTPVSPKPVRNIAFGALIGLVLGLGLALLLEQLDRRLKRQDDLAEATGLPCWRPSPSERRSIASTSATLRCRPPRPRCSACCARICAISRSSDRSSLWS